MKYVLVLLLLSVAGCAPTSQQIEKTLKENPKIITDFIRENPEQVLTALNDASMVMRQKQQQEFVARQKKQRLDELKNPKKPDLPKNRVYFGADKAPITIVKYSDFECPFCRRGYKTLEQVKEVYGSNVRVIYKHVPLPMHEQARPAAQYYEAIALQSHKKAREFYHYVFENQKNLTKKDFLDKAAKKVGANLPKLKKDLHSKGVASAIEADMKEFEGFGYTGTPVFLVNGVTLSGAQPYSAFKQLIDDQLKSVKK